MTCDLTRHLNQWNTASPKGNILFHFQERRAHYKWLVTNWVHYLEEVFFLGSVYTTAGNGCSPSGALFT